MASRSTAVQDVLSYLLDQDEAVTRPSIAQACALSRPTVFSAIERLEQLALVADVGRVSGKPGRSASLYEVASSAGLLAAIDIGGSNVRVAVTDVRGRLRDERREPTVRGGGHAIVRQVAEIFAAALSAVQADAQQIMSVAVSVPGVVDPDGSTVHYAVNIDQFFPFDFRSSLSAALGAPVTLENNVNLAAMGERWRGAAQDLVTFAVVAVGAGIGAGIVHEKTLLRGSHGAAGEVAFLPPYGARLRDHTTAHDEVGGLGLLDEAHSRDGWIGQPPVSVKELFERAAAGEPAALTLVEDEARHIASVIAAICAVVDPEKVILSGGVGGNDQLISRAEKLIAATTAFPPPVIRSNLSDRASLVGAIWLATREARKQLLEASAV